jgi:hypothetical protein
MAQRRCEARRPIAAQGRRAAQCVYGDDAGWGTAARPLVGRRSVDARCTRTRRAGRWHGGSWSGAWTDGR